MSSEKREKRPVVYCLVPRDLAARLHEPLRRFYRDDPSVEVIVERRARERRSDRERRAAEPEPRGCERRTVRNASGRRIGERRAALVAVRPRELPRRARRHAARLAFVERLEPSGQRAEDLDTARLVTRIQAGDRDAFADVYLRYFDRVYSYLLVVFGNQHDAEDATQQVFVQALEALPAYERRRQPFRAWLFAVVRNYALSELERQSRVELEDPAQIDRRREPGAPWEQELSALDWISDRDLVVFVERLPLPQRQVLLLRYMLDLSHMQIAAVLGRTHEDVRGLQYRAMRFLRARLTAIGRGPERGARSRMRRCPDHALVLRSRRFALYR